MLSVVFSNFCFILLPLIMQFAKQSHQSLLSPSLSDLFNMQALQELQRWMQKDLFSRPLCCSLCHSISAFTLCFDKVLNDKIGEILYEANKNNQKTRLVIVELVTE